MPVGLSWSTRCQWPVELAEQHCEKGCTQPVGAGGVTRNNKRGPHAGPAQRGLVPADALALTILARTSVPILTNVRYHS